MPKGRVTNGTVGMSRNSLQIYSFDNFRPAPSGVMQPINFTGSWRGPHGLRHVRVTGLDTSDNTVWVRMLDGPCANSRFAIPADEIEEA